MNSNIEERVLNVASHTIKTGDTVRRTAKVFGVSKSTVHKDLTERLPEVNLDLVEQVNCVLKKNLEERHIRGGEATKRKYAEMTWVKNKGKEDLLGLASLLFC